METGSVKRGSKKNPHAFSPGRTDSSHAVFQLLAPVGEAQQESGRKFDLDTILCIFGPICGCVEFLVLFRQESNEKKLRMREKWKRAG